MNTSIREKYGGNKYLKTVLENALKLNNVWITLRKLKNKFEINNRDGALKFAKNNCITTQEFCEQIDHELYNKIQPKIREMEIKCHDHLRNIDVKLGGPGNYALLYFLVKKYLPAIVVETGVAAGWTSLAILEALEENGQGHLHSSDLPYFRIKNSSHYVGTLVREEKLKKRWSLYVGDDRDNLPVIKEVLGDETFDLFHYDSDKSFSGRQFAFEAFDVSKLKDSLIVMDDIQDNLFFKNWVCKNNLKYSILSFENKYVGIIFL